jgi:alpha-mannosidase
MRMQTWVSDTPSYTQANERLGKHVIRYAIAPHAGKLDHTVVKESYNFNNPIRVHKHPDPIIFATLDRVVTWTGAPNVIIDVIKRGEDDEDIDDSSGQSLPKRKGRSVIIRLYDSLGGKSTGELGFGKLPVTKVFRCNLLEDDLSEFNLEDPEFLQLTVGAFEVVTLRLQLGGPNSKPKSGGMASRIWSN